MSDKELHIGDYGTIIEVTIIDPNTNSAQDISDADNKQFYFRNPAGTIINVSGTFKTDGSDGIVQYTVEDGDSVLETYPGGWILQVEIESTAGHWRSEKKQFTVYGNINT